MNFGFCRQTMSGLASSGNFANSGITVTEFMFQVMNRIFVSYRVQPMVISRSVNPSTCPTKVAFTTAETPDGVPVMIRSPGCNSSGPKDKRSSLRHSDQLIDVSALANLTVDGQCDGPGCNVTNGSRVCICSSEQIGQSPRHVPGAPHL